MVDSMTIRAQHELLREGADHGELHFADDQRKIIDAYLKGERVCVDAGEGTGKTTTLVEILCRRILEELKEHPESNPFERILVITFGVEASRDIKSKLKGRLREYRNKIKNIIASSSSAITEQEYWRLLENESHVETIDAFLNSLLREIAPFISIPSSFDVPAGIDQDRIVDLIIENITQDEKIKRKWDRLVEFFPESAVSFAWSLSARDILWRIHQKIREFCWSVEDSKRILTDGLKDTIYCGKAPPQSISDLNEIINRLSPANSNPSLDVNNPSNAIQYTKLVFELNLGLVEDFAEVLKAFDEEYDKNCRQTGALTYVDIAFLIWKFASQEKATVWRESLSKRYDDILVDEFQDTSYVQYSLIGKLVRYDHSNRMLLIGDIKQSIYAWRSADPGIFAEIILKSKAKEEIHGLGRISYFALTTNFRSQPELLYFFNGLFSTVFNNPATGAIVRQIPNEALEVPEPKGKNKRTGPTARIHVIANAETRINKFAQEESQKLVDIISGILGKDGLTVTDNGEERRAELGDIAVLFRRNVNIPLYVSALRSAGFKVAVLSDVSLFAETEVSFVIDLLDWLASPESRDPLVRILRSPLTSVSDKSMRYLASKRFLLNLALDQWPESLPEEDKARMQNLIALRSDLRWDREGRKSELISKIISHSFLDSVVLASEDGIQAQANLWQLMELVTSLEEESLITYKLFVERLKELRRRGETGDREFRRAVMALEKSSDSIRVMTIHAAKGLEYPILVLAESCVTVANRPESNKFVADREHGLLLKPRGLPGVSPIYVRLQNADKRHLPLVSAVEEESLLWITSRRDPSGSLARHTNIEAALREEIAEFWRLLYVALTRAKDHLIFSVSPRMNQPAGTSWMVELNNFVQYQNEPPGQYAKSIGMCKVGSEKVPKEILIGFEDLPRPTRSIPARPATVNWREISEKASSAKKPVPVPTFFPRVLNPSTYATLLACPRRFQYEILWRDAGYRLDATKAGAHPPVRMTAEDWGNRIHGLMEKRSFGVSVEHDKEIDGLLKNVMALPRGDKIARELRIALSNFESLPLATDLRTAFQEGKQIFKEKEFSQMLAITGKPPLIVQGKFDLLYELPNEKFCLVDYKSEERAPRGSYRELVHRAQIHAYGWAIERALGVNVSRAVIAYVHPRADVDNVVPDPRSFEIQIKSALDHLMDDFDSVKGLRATPSTGENGVCASCPYSANVGGPCEFGK